MRSRSAESAGAIRELVERIRELDAGQVNLMEVCGSHTMAIARAGIRQLLPENVCLISGPGCPVCVTPPQMIDAMLTLTERKDVIITTYGDMIKVPGSRRGDNLGARRAAGARVEIVYSPLDALELAERERNSEIVFLGVGFETTAPGTAAAVKTAAERGIGNFSVFSMLKTVEPALRALIADPTFNIQGFLCPGHVATIIGEKGFAFLPEEYHLPGVISGFEPEDILVSVYRLLRQIAGGRAEMENEYTRAVAPEGNPLALEMIRRVFEPRDDPWRGLGKIAESGLGLREEFAAFDAQRRYGLTYSMEEPPTACRCGQIIQGRLSPRECPLFGTACLPEDPVGPCMVSGEGACAAAYKYQEV